MNILKHQLLKIASWLVHSEEGKIIFYHDLHRNEAHTPMSTSLGLFQRHLETIQRCGYAVTEGMPKRHEVQITLDDGWGGIWECKEYLLEQRIYPTIFLAVDLIGKPGYLTRAQILQLQAMGFHFESHTWSHRDLTSFPRQELHHDLADSRQWLTDFLGREVTQLCFPIGYFSPLVLQEARKSGYQYLYSSIPGDVSWHLFPDVMTRNLVQSYTAEELGCVLRGGMGLFSHRYMKIHFKNV